MAKNTNHEVECRELQNALKISANHFSHKAYSTALPNTTVYSINVKQQEQLDLQHKSPIMALQDLLSL